MHLIAPPARQALLVMTLAAAALAAFFFAVILPSQRAPENAADREVAQKLAALLPLPRAVETTSHTALRVRDAIRREDFSAARRIVEEVFANSRLESWRYYPFSAFIGAISDLNDPSFAADLDAWAAHDKGDAAPLLIRAQYHYDLGWHKRGGQFIRDMQADNIAAFANGMKDAFADVEAAIVLSDQNPYAYSLRLRILQGLGGADAMKSAFQEAIAKYPEYFQLYEIYLRTLAPKWGGSVEAMVAFVDQYAGQAAEYSPLRLLYLSLYRDLLDSASVVCNPYWGDSDKISECVGAVMQKTVTRTLEGQAVAALQLYDHSDAYQFGLAIDEMLSDMLRSGGGDVFSGAILQFAATSMHSDSQLRQDAPHSNNYVIDKLVAQSWYAKGFYDNALDKDRQALKDIEVAAFPSETAQNLAVAGVYENMAAAFDRLDQYADLTAYEKAATALGGGSPAFAQFICYGYYKLKSFETAVRACTLAIDATGSLKARFWRSRAYRDLGQADLALADLAIVADSEDNFRTTAAIDISMNLFDRHNYRGALNELNKYAYLYDPATNSRGDIAVSYNNRCYAHMQLGELREALGDCSASLKFGSLPDAYRKQAELLKRLGAHESGL